MKLIAVVSFFILSLLFTSCVTVSEGGGYGNCKKPRNTELYKHQKQVARARR